MQPQHSAVSDHHVTEPVNIDIYSVGDGDLVDIALDEVAEILCESRCQPLMESAG